jgi:hypothetical protein
MQSDLLSIDEQALRDMYIRESSELTGLLLNGALWEEVQEKRHRVTQLAIALYKRTNPNHFPNPAENNIRGANNTAP